MINSRKEKKRKEKKRKEGRDSRSNTREEAGGEH